ncbi:MAG: glycosyltransferase family 2 protein [Planctomycetia bacterium]|nr:glycosyltransferase family 2 protein [Planctomycetia bacterium]
MMGDSINNNTKSPRNDFADISPGLRVLVIVPAYNEAARIGDVLSDLRQHAPSVDVVVVDDGSDDDTGSVAERAGATVLRLPCNLGVGGAMQTGYLYAAEKGYDVAVQFDGDGQHRANQISQIVAAVSNGDADLAIGSRLLGRRSYRFSPFRWIGSRLLSGTARLITGMRIADPTSGFRACSKRLIRFFAKHYPQTYLGDTVESLAIAARHGMRVKEVPARMRMTERSSINKFTGLFHTFCILLALLVDRVEAKFPEEPASRGAAGREARK